MDRLITICCIVAFVLYLALIIFFIIAFRNMIIDHKCYEMDNETFYSSKMCQKYWEDR